MLRGMHGPWLPGLTAAFAVIVMTSHATIPAQATAAGRGAAPRANPIPGTTCPMFPDNNYWHARVDRLPLHPMSGAWMAHMHSSINLHPDFGPSYGAQEVPYGIPITVVDGAPRVPVTFDYADESDSVPYPLGAETLIEGGPTAQGDRHAVVVDASTCTLFETWSTHQTKEGWTAGSGATWDLRSNALRPQGWTSADAAGLPILPGLLRWDEVSAGNVDHAIRFTTNVTRRAFVWPARHQAGSTNDPRFPPMGARFRLRASYPTAGLSREAATVIVALKRYGLVLADNGSPWYFQGTSDPDWPAALVDELKSIPASAFEAVDTSRMKVAGNSAAVRP
jgi:hypothetical protein